MVRVGVFALLIALSVTDVFAAGGPRILPLAEWLKDAAPGVIADSRIAHVRVLISGDPPRSQVLKLLLCAASGELREVRAAHGMVRFFGRRSLAPPDHRSTDEYCTAVETANASYYTAVADLLDACWALRRLRTAGSGTGAWTSDWRRVLDRPYIPLQAAPPLLASLARAALSAPDQQTAGEHEGVVHDHGASADQTLCRLATLATLQFYVPPPANAPKTGWNIYFLVVDNGWYDFRCDSLYNLVRVRTSPGAAAKRLGLVGSRCDLPEAAKAVTWLAQRVHMPVVVWNWRDQVRWPRTVLTGESLLSHLVDETGTRIVLSDDPKALVMQRCPPWSTGQLYPPRTMFAEQHEMRQLLGEWIGSNPHRFATTLAENGFVVRWPDVPTGIRTRMMRLLQDEGAFLAADRRGRAKQAETSRVGLRLFVKLYMKTPRGSLVERTAFSTPQLPPPPPTAQQAAHPTIH